MRGLHSQLHDSSEKLLYSHEVVELVALTKLHINKEELHEKSTLVKAHHDMGQPRLLTVFSSEEEEIEEVNFPNTVEVKHNTIHDLEE